MSLKRKKRVDEEPEVWEGVLLVLTSPCYIEAGADSLSGRPQVSGVQAWPPAARNAERAGLWEVKEKCRFDYTWDCLRGFSNSLLTKLKATLPLFTSSTHSKELMLLNCGVGEDS